MQDLFHELRHIAGVNILQELRDANKQLKAKLEEHSTDMERLQKGYDILDIEFKIMKCNYTSLVASARGEIQRKSQMIAKLTAEKELLMKNAIKGGKHVRRHANKIKKHQAGINNDKASGKGNKKTKEDDPKQANDDITCER